MPFLLSGLAVAALMLIGLGITKAAGPPVSRAGTPPDGMIAKLKGERLGLPGVDFLYSASSDTWRPVITGSAPWPKGAQAIYEGRAYNWTGELLERAPA